MQHLNSIYDLLESVDSYQWKLTSKNKYEFKDIIGNKYLVEFIQTDEDFNNKEYYELSYYVWDEKAQSYSVTKLVNSNPYKILQTIFGEILLNFVNTNKNIGAIKIEGLSKDFEKEYVSQRTKMYLRYLQRNPIPGFRIQNYGNRINLIKTDFLNEELDIDKFGEFIKKYNKTNYISQSSAKKLKESGVDIKNLEKIISDIDLCLDFFKKQDHELFQELMQYIKDDVPGFIRKVDIFYQINIEYKSRLYSGSYLGNVTVMDNSGMLTKKEILNNVISKSISDINMGIRNTQQRISNTNDKLWKRMHVRDLKKLQSGEVFNEIKISPVLTLGIYNTCNGFDDGSIEIRRKKLEIIQNTLSKGDVIPTYLDMIGCGNITHVSDGLFKILPEYEYRPSELTYMKISFNI